MSDSELTAVEYNRYYGYSGFDELPAQPPAERWTKGYDSAAAKQQFEAQLAALKAEDDAKRERLRRWARESN